MRRPLFYIILVVFWGFIQGASAQNIPRVSVGRIDRISAFESKYVAARNIDVWLPANYDPKKKYRVIYMHDGQNLFDSNLAFGKQEWRVDETMDSLLQTQKIEPCLVVGIWNSGATRHAEYFPEAFLPDVQEPFRSDFVQNTLQGKPLSDAYLKFIVEELKPFIDRSYSTIPGKEGTFILGSSMGGLLSVYAWCQYPEVFSGAGGLSVAWVGKAEKNYELPLAAFQYLSKNIPGPLGRKIYMDHGDLEMDTMYGVYQPFVDVIFQRKGYFGGAIKSTKYANSGHNERDWARILPGALEFLVGKPPMQEAEFGKIVHHNDFSSAYIIPRNVDVWLPEHYDPSKRYPVLYMHDGQMLFDARATWNHSSWELDQVLHQLHESQQIRDVIVVGICNSGIGRHADYIPQKPFESLTEAQQERLFQSVRPNGNSVFNAKPIASDLYLKFIVYELKPFIDKTYPTLPDAKNTFIAGSSMGGLISIYAICEYPNIFGGAACMSTHWPGIFTLENNPFPDVMLHYLRIYLPNPKNHRIYFDCGDQTLDALYPGIQKKVDAIMRARGYGAKSWVTRYFPGEAHLESAWNKRVDVPLMFLLKQ